jgi:hypothetical protein
MNSDSCDACLGNQVRTFPLGYNPCHPWATSFQCKNPCCSKRVVVCTTSGCNKRRDYRVFSCNSTGTSRAANEHHYKFHKVNGGGRTAVSNPDFGAEIDSPDTRIGEEQHQRGAPLQLPANNRAPADEWTSNPTGPLHDGDQVQELTERFQALQSLEDESTYESFHRYFTKEADPIHAASILVARASFQNTKPKENLGIGKLPARNVLLFLYVAKLVFGVGKTQQFSFAKVLDIISPVFNSNLGMAEIPTTVSEFQKMITNTYYQQKLPYLYNANSKTNNSR